MSPVLADAKRQLDWLIVGGPSERGLYVNWAAAAPYASCGRMSATLRLLVGKEAEKYTSAHRRFE